MRKFAKSHLQLIAFPKCKTINSSLDEHNESYAYFRTHGVQKFTKSLDESNLQLESFTYFCTSRVRIFAKSLLHIFALPECEHMHRSLSATICMPLELAACSYAIHTNNNNNHTNVNLDILLHTNNSHNKHINNNTNNKTKSPITSNSQSLQYIHAVNYQ